MPGEWIHCDRCGALVDSEDYPEGFYILERGTYICECCADELEVKHDLVERGPEGQPRPPAAGAADSP